MPLLVRTIKLFQTQLVEYVLFAINLQILSDLELILTRLSNSNIQIYVENSSKRR